MIKESDVVPVQDMEEHLQEDTKEPNLVPDIQRRLPKFGFKNINRKEYKSINIEVIQSLCDKNGWEVITPENLVEAGLVRKNDLIKILGQGTITSKVEVKAHAFSKTAEAAIEAAQGTVVKL